MLGDASQEGIGLERIFTLQQTEVITRNDQVEIARLLADAAIALVRLDVCCGLDLETNPSAVATSEM